MSIHASPSPIVYLQHALNHIIYKDEKEYVGVDVVILPQEWQIQIHPRRGVTRQEVEDLLNRLGIPFENSWRRIYSTYFDYDEDLSRIAPVVQDIVNKLSAAAG